MSFVNFPCSSNRRTTLRPPDFLSCSYSSLCHLRTSRLREFILPISNSLVNLLGRSFAFSSQLSPSTSYSHPGPPGSSLNLAAQFPSGATLGRQARILLYIHSTDVVFSQERHPLRLLCTLEETSRIASPPSSNPELPSLRTLY
jgi:hypothetical protein